MELEHLRRHPAKPVLTTDFAQRVQEQLCKVSDEMALASLHEWTWKRPPLKVLEPDPEWKVYYESLGRLEKANLTRFFGAVIASPSVPKGMTIGDFRKMITEREKWDVTLEKTTPVQTGFAMIAFGMCQS